MKDKGVALRGLFIINPEGVLEQCTINNMPIGRSVDEALRLLQAIQFTAEHGEVSQTTLAGSTILLYVDEECQCYLLMFSSCMRK